MNIEQTLETSYISLDYALLRVLVRDKNKYKDLLELHTYDHDDYFVAEYIPDLEKRAKYKVPDFVESIRFSKDIELENCILIMVLEGYDIIELHNWIQTIENK